MHRILTRFTLLFLALFGFSGGLMAQENGSLQRVTVTSVTITVDTVQTVEEMEKVAAIVQSWPEVRDFDIKLRKCNFTHTGDPLIYQDIIKKLEQQGYLVNVFRAESGNTFTIVPEESCEKKQQKEITEEEYLKSLKDGDDK